MYCERSVLEKYHASQLMRLISKPDNNILETQTAENVQLFRRLAISSILATDMSKHAEIVRKLEENNSLPLKKQDK